MRDAGLHVEDAGPMQPAVSIASSGIRVELTDRPDGVEVAEQQNLRRAAAEFGEQMVAAIGARQPRHACRRSRQPRRQARRRSDRPPALSVVGDSSRTSVSTVSISHACSARQKFRRSIIEDMSTRADTGRRNAVTRQT